LGPPPPRSCVGAARSMADPARRRRGSLAVEVTARCDRACRYCYHDHARAARVPDLPADELVALVLGALAASGLGGVQITGGEPLLRADLFPILEGLGAPARRVSLVTDGGLLDDASIRELARLRVGPIQPTLLAATRTLHDDLKGAQGFDATVDGIARMRRAGLPVTVSFVCTAANHGAFRQVIELCFALGVEAVALSRLCTAGEGARHAADLLPTAAHVRGCLDVAEDAVTRLGMRVHVAISLPLCIVDPRRYPHLRFGRCALTSGDPGYTIDPQGRLRACSVSPLVLGDLRREPWDVIVKRARATTLADLSRPPAVCAGCPMVDACGGGCRESARGVHGDTHQADPLARPPLAADPRA